MNIHRGVKHRHLTDLGPGDEAAADLSDERLIDVRHRAADDLRPTGRPLQDPDDNGQGSRAPASIRWDGKFVANPAVVGAWQTVGYVNRMDDFDAAKPRDASRARIKALTLKADGRTDSSMMIWTGDTLMDLLSNQALRMVVKDLAGARYLFIEQGGFQTKYGMDWQSPWIVMKQTAQ
jgi:hypothetical protein